jgi:hypothetical protein
MLAQTSSSNIQILGFYMIRKGFIIREFLTQRDKGKIGIKITKVIIMNLGIFGENFIIF